MAIYELEPRIYYDAALPVDISQAVSPTNHTGNTAGNNTDNNNTDNDNTPDSRDYGSDRPDITDSHNILLDDTDVVTVDDDGLSGFGDSVAVDGDYAVVGAHNQDGTGVVYVFKHTKNGNWKMVQKITADDGESGDGFGVSVAIHKNTIVVGADGADDAGEDSGAVYVFENKGGEWIQTNKITAIDGNAGDGFGESVDIDGEFIAVGAAGDDDAGEDSGSVYVFERENGEWLESDKIVASDADSHDAFGDDVAIDEGQIVVGATGDNDDTGSAYVFKYDGYSWREQAKLHGDNSMTGDNFGYAVDIEDGAIVVGAWGNDEYGTDSGSVYVFEHTHNGSWYESGVLHASDAAAGDNFGIDVQIDGRDILVGASGKDDGTGAAYLFRETIDGFKELRTFTVDNGQPGSHFGDAVAISGKNIIIGAPDTDYTYTDSGVAYIPHLDIGGDTGEDTGEDTTGSDINDYDDQDISDSMDDPGDEGDEFDNEGEDQGEGEGEGEEEGEGEGEGETGSGEGGENGGEQPNHIPGHVGHNSSPYNFGAINPPNNSHTLASNEQTNVEFFDARAMQTAYSMPNGEFQASVDTHAPTDVFKHIAQSNQYAENTGFNAGLSHAELGSDVTVSALTGSKVANNIISGYINSVEGGEHEEINIKQEDHNNVSLSDMIRNFFLSDKALESNGITSEKDMDINPHNLHKPAKHPAFQNSLDKSIDAIFGF